MLPSLYNFTVVYVLGKREKESPGLGRREKGFLNYRFLFISFSLESGEDGVGAQGIGQGIDSLGGDVVVTKAKGRNVFEHCEEGSDMSKMMEEAREKFLFRAEGHKHAHRKREENKRFGLQEESEIWGT